MANSEHLEKLYQGPKIWNAWRDENPDVVPDLADAKLTLSQRQFGLRNGGPINLSGAYLEGAALRYATLTQADLSGAQLNGADLTHARLDSVNLVAADLTDALLDNADFAGAHMERAVLVGASLVNARNLSQEQVQLAYGDSSTLLPASLMPPQSWFPTIEDDDFDDYTEYPVPDLIADENPYQILGVEASATHEDIRRAYRGLVKKLHPDLNPNDPEAQDLFKKVSSAYNLLSNTEKRARFDKGEIDAEGRVNRDFQARRHYRRYAFRFYAAAAMSLMLVAGLLGVIWHAVLTDNPNAGKVQIALSPPKHTDRLSEKPIAPPRERAAPQHAAFDQAERIAQEPEQSSTPSATSTKADKPSSIVEDRPAGQQSQDTAKDIAKKKADSDVEGLAGSEQAAQPVATDKKGALISSSAHGSQAGDAALSVAPLKADTPKQAQRLPQSKPDLAANATSSAVQPQSIAANDVSISREPGVRNDAEPASANRKSNQLTPGENSTPAETETPRIAALTTENGAVPSADLQSAPPAEAPEAKGDAQPVLANPIADPGVPPDLQANEQPRSAATQSSVKRSAILYIGGEHRPVDAVSAFLTARALERILVRENGGEIASVETPAKAKAEDGVVQDFYFHSIEGKGKDEETPEFSAVPFENEPADAGIINQNVPVLPMAKGVATVTQEPQPPAMAVEPAPAKKREEVVSDILAGGL